VQKLGIMGNIVSTALVSIRIIHTMMGKIGFNAIHVVLGNIFNVRREKEIILI
jgi:hypothetical protein